mmetsp:Transcript_68486/g.161006  ORF Transcript_68486/g.161006 Transcript_68486/m.161006 type:complete len:222 (-) Transcript_68486:205-870(-)
MAVAVGVISDSIRSNNDVGGRHGSVNHGLGDTVYRHKTSLLLLGRKVCLVLETFTCLEPTHIAVVNGHPFAPSRGEHTGVEACHAGSVRVLLCRDINTVGSAPLRHLQEEIEVAATTTRRSDVAHLNASACCCRVRHQLMEVAQIRHGASIVHEATRLMTCCCLEDSVHLLVVRCWCIRDAHANAKAALLQTLLYHRNELFHLLLVRLQFMAPRSCTEASR